MIRLDDSEQVRQLIKEVVNAALDPFQRETAKTYSDLQQRFVDIDKQIAALKTSIESRAQERAVAEVVEARQRLEIAEQRANSLSTQERIQVKEMFAEQADQESKQRAQKRREFWDKVLPNIATGLIMVFAAPIALALMAAILIFLANVFKIPIPPP